MAEQKIILCDIHNTLLNSRARQFGNTFFFSLIHEDTVNYPILQLLRSMAKVGYKIVFFAYCNSRYQNVVDAIIKKLGFKESQYTLYVDANSRYVISPYRLKSYIYDNVLKDQDIIYALDADEESIGLWKSHDITVLNIEE